MNLFFQICKCQPWWWGSGSIVWEAGFPAAEKLEKLKSFPAAEKLEKPNNQSDGDLKLYASTKLW